MFRANYLLLAFLAIGASVAAEKHWSYPNLETDEDFPSWGGLCDSGSRQSPINLGLKMSLKGVFDELEFDNYNDKQIGVTIVNNGHTIQLANFSSEMKLEGGPLLDEYVAEQIHMHWWSEHTIDNVRYPLETHIVHRNKRYADVNAANNHKDGLAVLSILYHVSNERNEALDLILENLDAVKSYSQMNKPVRLKQSLVVRQLFPKVKGYMTYAGSLTTPSCAESVTWIVLSETFPVTLDQINSLKEVEYEEGKQLKNNYRNVQNSRNRPVIYVMPEEEERTGAANTLRASVSIFALLWFVSKVLL